VRIWLIIIAAGLGTYGFRASFIVLGDRLLLPPFVERALRYVGPAAFAAITLPLLLDGDGFSNFSDDLPRIAAGIAAALIVWKRDSIPLSLIVGMGTLWLITWLT
jgi:branched-subunit amino acid transport protein